MADIVRRRNDRDEVGQMAGLEPIRSSWSLLGDSEPLRDMQRLLRFDQDRTFNPRIDVKETQDAYIFKVDLPGVKEQEVDIAVLGNRLTISARRELESAQVSDTFYVVERAQGTFSRSFILPDGADADQVRAEMKDGVLTVTVPKRPNVQPRKVTLGQGGAGSDGGNGNKTAE